jgi:hypothetical protein
MIIQSNLLAQSIIRVFCLRLLRFLPPLQLSFLVQLLIHRYLGRNREKKALNKFLSASSTRRELFFAIAFEHFSFFMDESSEASRKTTRGEK